MTTSSKRLGVVEFGRQLLRLGDLDPLYIALWESKIKRLQMCRWLVCYWCFYHAGLCCWVSEQRDFFGTMLEVARGGTKYPRGTERRHFRGKLAIESVTRLQESFGSAPGIVQYLMGGGLEANAVATRAKQLYGFGEWISWKIPDMLERLWIRPVRFREDDLYWMFKTSREGAQETAKAHGLNGILGAHQYLIEHLGSNYAPPRYNRLINVQETETIFCKWKSHLGGRYPVGKDTHEIRLGLLRYDNCKTSRRMLRGLRDGLLEARNG